jgi:hypothetical protein
MLLVHAELCHRAGFAISWNASRKDDYLETLTRELGGHKASTWTPISYHWRLRRLPAAISVTISCLCLTSIEEMAAVCRMLRTGRTIPLQTGTTSS